MPAKKKKVIIKNIPCRDKYAYQKFTIAIKSLVTCSKPVKCDWLFIKRTPHFYYIEYLASMSFYIYHNWLISAGRKNHKRYRHEQQMVAINSEMNSTYVCGQLLLSEARTFSIAFAISSQNWFILLNLIVRKLDKNKQFTDPKRKKQNVEVYNI